MGGAKPWELVQRTIGSFGRSPISMEAGRSLHSEGYPSAAVHRGADSLHTLSEEARAHCLEQARQEEKSLLGVQLETGHEVAERYDGQRSSAGPFRKGRTSVVQLVQRPSHGLVRLAQGRRPLAAAVVDHGMLRPRDALPAGDVGLGVEALVVPTQQGHNAARATLAVDPQRAGAHALVPAHGQEGLQLLHGVTDAALLLPAQPKVVVAWNTQHLAILALQRTQRAPGPGLCINI
mmetsp:Transcript_55661/g.180663  ORF Transcript_55661/g.180663 Transcript_55661/m.180663 type:complete len:235 (+) Transcript_55661:170-874(+)